MGSIETVAEEELLSKIKSLHKREGGYDDYSCSGSAVVIFN